MPLVIVKGRSGTRGIPALSCQRAIIEAVRNASELPLEWKTGEKTCEVGEGCQDLVMLLENGPRIHLLIIKDCVKAEDQEPRVIWLRTGPGLSIVSYTRVCHHSDFCNDVSSTEVLGDLPTPTVPGSLRCPLCLSKDGCKNAPEQVCPAGSSHCYSGVLRLRGESITTNLRVQGCMPQPACNLLNGTKAIGPLDMSENCGLQLGPQALDCNSGTLDTVRNVLDLHLSWTTGWKTCEAGQGCQETLMLIQNGQEFHMVLTKGCTSDSNREAQITRHRTGPGISIITYVHVCRHQDFCNDLSTTRNLWIPPSGTVPGTLRCPHCLSTRGCENAPEQVCPEGSTHCYSGVLRLRGEGIDTSLKVQGCVPQAGCNLFDGTKAIGPIDVLEDCGPQSQALKCQHGTLEITRNVSQLPLQWTAGQTTCDVGEGCQDTLVMIENGEKVNLVLTKGCTTAEDQEAKVTEHRTGPGLSVTSYTRVCRLGDFCNGLSTTAPLWAPPPVTVPGTTRCPLCFSTHGCENPPKQVCPAGSSHCYSGVLSLRGGEIISNLRVQGCMSQPGCNLLNGTQTIGPMNVREDCSPQKATLTCYKGIIVKPGSGFAETAVEWSAPSTLACEPEELCQETLLLVDVAGPKTLLIGSKGCIRPGAEDSAGVSIHSRPPGILVASYSRFCSSNLCNEASNSSSVLLSPLPRPTALAPGDLRCPVCVGLYGSCFNYNSFVACPRGTTRCYNGDIVLQGGDLSFTMSIQGCMSSSGKTLLGDSKTIGIFSAKEFFEDENDEKPLDGGASAPSLAWVLGLGLSLALCLVLSDEPIFLWFLTPIGCPQPSLL
ncbi:CD177 antigen isoform X3 [Peromyscus maniculatus bairdii]|uniref:CD177 antigen isoform X3 n=1 Tax=Peromyscus maniculatus bairdii TaxID=230844 RepID=UPI001C2E4399|nr:CD177 antigen isoform X2 [Peromyscus maniculatus bairdii]